MLVDRRDRAFRRLDHEVNREPVHLNDREASGRPVSGPRQGFEDRLRLSARRGGMRGEGDAVGLACEDVLPDFRPPLLPEQGQRKAPHQFRRQLGQRQPRQRGQRGQQDQNPAQIAHRVSPRQGKLGPL